MAQPRIQLIGEEHVDPPAPGPNQQDVQEAHLRALLLTSLRALGQRAITAVTNLFSFGLVLSVWLLVSRVLDDPTPLRLYALGGYAGFCLAVDIVRRRRAA